MRRSTVDSSAIRSVGYDFENSTLEIEFDDGDVYRYWSVPEYVHDELLHAPSRGRFFQERIRDKFFYQKM